jgi:hypothetical protein
LHHLLWSLQAALREYNPMPYKMYLVEVNKDHCAGAEKVLQLNKLENAVLWCDLWNLDHFRAYANSVAQIDVIDMDCDGCEREMLPPFSDIFAAKVKRAIIACHWPDCHNDRSWLDRVFPATLWRQVDGYGSAANTFNCITGSLFSGKFDAANSCPQVIRDKTSLGPFSHNDGTVVMDNIALLPEPLPIFLEG